MRIWEVDIYRRPVQDAAGKPLWELAVCDPAGTLRYAVTCPQSQVSANWLAGELQKLMAQATDRPAQIHSFRPQAINLLQPVCEVLAIPLKATRQTSTLKQWLVEKWQPFGVDPLALESPAPVPIPASLGGERWRFASLPAAELADAFRDRPIPILEMPPGWLPLNLALPSTLPIPGVVFEAGRQAMRLALWLQAAQPATLSYISGAPDGLILATGLVDRWVLATFEDAEVSTAGQKFEQRKQASQGLHFLLIQPDDSGITYSGFWLLK